MYTKKEYQLEKTTIWSFPERGDWATHNGRYRGNWSPHIPRNLILRYSHENDTILDQFVGSGTTLVEAKILNRNAIGIDVNKNAIDISKRNLQFCCDYDPNIRIGLGNSTNLEIVKDKSVDFICTHPPYADIIKYSSNIKDDISLLSVEVFLEQMTKVANESFRVLKNNKYCAIMMGDIRKKGTLVPLGFNVMDRFLNAGFSLKEIIIKEQHNCKSTEHWINKNNNFLLLAHEYIFVFYKN